MLKIQIYHHRNNLHLNIINIILNCNNISQLYSFICISDQINAALVNIFSTCLKTLNSFDPKLWNF